MYDILKASHNGLRWVLLALLIFVIVRSWLGFAQKSTYGKLDNATGGALVGLSHLQLLIGFILYFGLSPITQAAFADFGAAMKDPTLRLYAVEHLTTMLVAVILIQVGRIFSKKAAEDARKFRVMAVFTTFALVLMASRMPHWNF
jgi:hypothetical protein